MLTLFNHSISIQKILRLVALIFLIVSCAGVKTINNKQAHKKQTTNGFCSQEYHETEKRHLVMAAKIKSSVLANCFRNFLRFEENKKQKISVCNQISIKRSGRVSYVQVTNANKRVLPKDLKMCIEQEYWKMNFSGLQLISSHLIQFQLNFSSI